MGFWSRLFGGERTKATAEGREAPTAPPPAAEGLDAARLAFLEMVAERLRDLYPDLDFHRDVEAFALHATGADGDEPTLFLENVFAETRDLSPEARDERVRRVVGVLAAAASTGPGVTSWEDARPRLVLCLRSATFSTAVAKGERATVSRPFVPMLAELVALDAPDAIQYVGMADVEAWGVSAADVLAAARERMDTIDTRMEPYDPEAPFPLWVVANDDDYEPSRLLEPGWLAAQSSRVRGRPIAIVPTNRLLIVGGDGDDACVRRLVEIAEREYRSAPRALSPALYTVDDDANVVPLRMPRGHALAGDVERGHLLLAHAEYTTQQGALQSAAATRGDTAFVATYTLLRSGDGSLVSCATWSKGVPSLLPEVDRIAFVVGALGKDSFMAPWSAVAALEPPCLAVEPGLDPPRHRTVRFPEARELQALREASA